MMKLLALVVALMLVRWIHVSPQNPVMAFKTRSWLSAYWILLQRYVPNISRYWSSTPVFLAVWLVPGLLVAGLAFLLSFAWMGLLTVLLSGLALWACLPDFSELLPHHRDANSLMAMAHENLFAVVFWFVVLGPAGAVLYHSLTIYQEYSERQEPTVIGWKIVIDWTHRLAAWIPARLTALFFALVGNFETGFQCWRKLALNPNVSAEKLVVACGQAALVGQMPSANQDPALLAFTLVERASFVWLIVVAAISFNI